MDSNTISQKADYSENRRFSHLPPSSVCGALSPSSRIGLLALTFSPIPPQKRGIQYLRIMSRNVTPEGLTTWVALQFAEFYHSIPSLYVLVRLPAPMDASRALRAPFIRGNRLCGRGEAGSPCTFCHSHGRNAMCTDCLYPVVRFPRLALPCVCCGVGGAVCGAVCVCLAFVAVSLVPPKRNMDSDFVQLENLPRHRHRKSPNQEARKTVNSSC